MNKTMVYVIGITPNKMGGNERFAVELAAQMEKFGWMLVLCFEAAPSELVRESFRTPNVFFEIVDKQSCAGIRQYLKLARIILRYRPAVLVYAFNGVLRFIPWTATLLGVQTLFYNDHSSRSYQGIPPRKAAGKRALGRLMTLPLDGVICVSDFVSECVRQERWVPAHKVHTIYNGVDIYRDPTGGPLQARAARFREKYSIAADRKIVLKVSWLVPEKGIDTFLQAARRVVASEPKTHFVIVGTGHRFDTYRALASELGIRDNCTWTGALEDPTQAGAFAAAQISCQLSRWQEAFGFSIIEAMACGVPVVASRAGGIPEIVRDGANGFLVPIDDPEAASERILTLLRSDAMREEMGRAARSDAVRKFDARETAKAYLEILGIRPLGNKDGRNHGNRGTAAEGEG